MSESQHLSPRGAILAAQEAILGGDVEAFVRFFASDAVLEFPNSAGALPARVQGHEAIRGAIAELRARLGGDGRRLRGLSNLAVHETTDPEIVVVEFEALGEASEGAEGYRLPDIQVWRVRDGLVRSVRDYLGALGTNAVRPPVIERATGVSAWG